MLLGDDMKSVGIICEYNPFHNGHLYHLNKVKELFPNYTIILVMSGNYTERGETSILNKWDKTDIALTYGADLVIELPFVFASQSADIFAHGAIAILKELNVDYLVFGSETNDIDKLKEMASIQVNNRSFDKLVTDYLSDGVNYPTAISKAIFDLTHKKVSKPNDILGVTYIKEIIKQKANIKPICIKRNDNYNCTELSDFLSSATSIRHAIQNGVDVKNEVPERTYHFLDKKLHFISDYFPIIKYNILNNLDDLKKFQTVDEGIDARIRKYIINSRSLDELILKIKTKRYTYNKLNRMFTHIMCNFTKEEADLFTDITYIRVLGFNPNGRLYLNNIKKDVNIPIITNFSSIKDKMLDIEFRTTCVYASLLDEKEKITLIESEYKNSPIQK